MTFWIWDSGSGALVPFFFWGGGCSALVGGLGFLVLELCVDCDVGFRVLELCFLWAFNPKP